MNKTHLGLALALVASFALADHNAVQLDKLVLGLPAGWEARITRPEFTRYGVPELFQLQIDLPTVQFEYEFMPGDKRLVHPALTLCFYAPLTEKQYVDFQKKVEDEVAATDQPPPRMVLFVKTENYWIFSPQSPDQFRHLKDQEIYHHVKGFLSVNPRE